MGIRWADGSTAIVGNATAIAIKYFFHGWHGWVLALKGRVFNFGFMMVRIRIACSSCRISVYGKVTIYLRNDKGYGKFFLGGGGSRKC